MGSLPPFPGPCSPASSSYGKNELGEVMWAVTPPRTLLPSPPHPALALCPSFPAPGPHSLSWARPFLNYRCWTPLPLRPSLPPPTASQTSPLPCQARSLLPTFLSWWTSGLIGPPSRMFFSSPDHWPEPPDMSLAVAAAPGLVLDL